MMVVLGSASHSLFVQAAWSAAAGRAAGTGPAAIAFAERVSWAVHDLGGMIVPYGALTASAMLLALLCAGAVARFSGHRTVVFGLAGAAAIWVLFTMLRLFLGTVGVFGARGPAGLAGQMAAGCAAALLFARLTAGLKKAVK
jgi:hypothetical protein